MHVAALEAHPTAGSRRTGLAGRARQAAACRCLARARSVRGAAASTRAGAAARAAFTALHVDVHPRLEVEPIVEDHAHRSAGAALASIASGPADAATREALDDVSVAA